jgi:enoyl-[acyl-carrier protein] reductase II
MFAAMALGADGVQVGSRFVASEEASAHQNFKNAVIHATEGDTQLSLKKVVPVRLLKNAFFELVNEAEMRGASKEELQQILGRGRSKKGMLEGNLDEGELEIGQVSSMIREILPAKTIIRNLWKEFEEALQNPLAHY